MSKSAFESLTLVQKSNLEEFCELFPLNVNTIERIGGGSVRCMIAEIFLSMKNENTTKPILHCLNLASND